MRWYEHSLPIFKIYPLFVSLGFHHHSLSSQTRFHQCVCHSLEMRTDFPLEHTAMLLVNVLYRHVATVICNKIKSKKMLNVSN